MGKYDLNYILDTCAMIWWSNKIEKLSNSVSDILSDTAHNHFIISSISFWEAGLKIKKGILDVGMSIQDYVKNMQMAAEVTIIPVDENIWIENLNLNWEHRDPADRTIVAMATVRDLPIITKDKIIKNFYQNVIW